MADAMLARIELLRFMLAPPGERPVFHELKSKPEALRWWRQHRYDELGQQALQTMDRQAVLELDVALSRQIEAEQASEAMGG